MCLTSRELDVLEDVIFAFDIEDRMPKNLTKEHLDMLKALWSRETGTPWNAEDSYGNQGNIQVGPGN